MKCPACNSDKISVFLKFKGYSYLKCEACALVFLANPGTINYDAGYLKGRGHDLFDSAVTLAKRKTANFYLDKLCRYLAPGGAILDVGCSTGIMLRVAREKGFKIYGIDINKEAIDIARGYLNDDNIVCAELLTAEWDNLFSIVLMVDSFEHFPDPRAVLKKLYSMLRAGGVLFLVTPDIESLTFKILKKRWFHLFPEHLYLFSKRSLKFVLEEAGFALIETGNAKKFISPEIIYRHLEIHKNIIFAAAIAVIIRYLPAKLKNLTLPFKMGEIYAVAKK